MGWFPAGSPAALQAHDAAGNRYEEKLSDEMWRSDF